MKKITLLLLLFITGWQINAQSTCLQTFTASGMDNAPTVLTINASDITCNGANPITNLVLKNAGGSLTSGVCSTWFTFHLSIDGGPNISGCGAGFNDINITGFNTLTITSQDIDAYPDTVNFRIDVETTYTPMSPPGCTALSTPANGAINVMSPQISWPASTGGALGYILNVGTTAGGTDVINGQDLGNVLTHNLGTLTPATTYYVTVIGYNGIGNAVGCTETSFTTCGTNTVPATENFATFLPGCWQEANGGDIAAGPANFGTGDWEADGFLNSGGTGSLKINVYYNDKNEWVVSPLYAIPSTGYEVKFDAATTQWNGTGAPTTAWEADDYVQVLVSNDMTNWSIMYTYDSNNIPSNAAALNIIDLDNFAGQSVRFAFRAVEGTADGLADIDFFIDNFEVRATPSCPEPLGLLVNNVTATSADITWTATTGNYEYVLDQVATNPAGAGTTLAGELYSATPLMGSATYYFHVRTNCGGTYSTWSTISFNTLPANDDCATAVTLTPGGVFADYSVTGTTVGATTVVGLNYGCQTSRANEVWYSVDVPASGTLTIETKADGASPLTDTVVSVFSGTCGSLTEIGCDDDAGDVNFSLINLTGLTPATTIYVGVWRWGSATNGTFRLSAYDASLSTPSFDSASFQAYPNPVKNVLNLSYTSEISSVEVYNMLGQKVMDKTLNVTQGQVDMSNLNAGNYIVKVTADGMTKSIKVIKQ